MRHELLKPFDRGASANARPIFMVKDGDEGFGGAPDKLAALATINNFKGDAGALLSSEEGVLLGCGDGADPFIIAAAADKLPEGEYTLADDVSDDDATRLSFSWLLGGYRFDRYKKSTPAQAILFAPENADLNIARREADAVGLVRNLVNTPAGDMTPEELETTTCAIADEYNAKMNVIFGDDLLAENYPMVHAVGRAAAATPRLIDMTWGDEDAPRLTLVGKGVCFDTGGLNLKGGAGMALMKKDMGGAAHVLALSQMIMNAGLKVRLRMIVPAVENAVAGNAFRPGDVLQSRKGLSVEIGNTDAEGRLILADALALGAEDEPDLMISLATLTGAARVAVGPELAPFYCDDDGFAAALTEAATRKSDPVWRMPLWAGYKSMLSSQVADINHISSGGFAGSITAALFLQRFVPETIPWAHFDIYAWRPKALPGRPIGGEAQAIRALYDILARRYPA